MKNPSELKPIWQPNNWQLSIIFVVALGLCGCMAVEAQKQMDEDRLHRQAIIHCHDVKVKYDMVIGSGHYSPEEQIDTIYSENPSMCYYKIGENDPFSNEWKNFFTKDNITNDDWQKVYDNIDKRAMQKLVDGNH